MLIKISYANKKDSIYECDLCSKKLNGETVIRLYAERNRKFRPIYDVCEKCLNKIKNRRRKG